VEDYDQVAIVANVAADRPHDGTAYERFTPSGPLAVLPLYDGSYGVIWSCSPADAAGVLSLTGDSYLRELQAKKYKYYRPGIQLQPWNAKEMAVIDPFGNRIRFSEFVEEKPAARSKRKGSKR